MLASVIASTIEVDKIFTVQDVRVGRIRPPPNFEAITSDCAGCQWAVAYLFFTAIWAMKGAFLAFYDGLTQRLPAYRRAWWFAIVFTIVTYIGALFAYAFLIGLKVQKGFHNRAINYGFSVDLVTDVFSECHKPEDSMSFMPLDLVPD